MTGERAGVTAQLAAFASGLEFRDVPALGVERALASITDWVGCALAGSESPAAASVAAAALLDGGLGAAQVIGRPLRLPAQAAALINGTAGHALDFDDSSPPMIGHPSTSIVPALFALAESLASPGTEVVASYVAGLEAAARLGRHLNPQHYAAGWHATATLGTLGATVAAARLLRFDAPALRTALGIAASSAAGIRANFGSEVKPLHAGFAARNAVLAVRLTACGMTSDPDALDGDRGFFAVFCGGATPDLQALRFAADQELEIVASGVGIKPYACCGCTHSAVDAMLALREAHAIDPSAVDTIDCTMNALVPDILVHHRPSSAAQARFSMEYCLAVALLDGDCGTAQFTEERVAAPRVQSLLRRVHTRVDPAIIYRNGVYPGTVRVTLADGRAFERHVEEATGHPDVPMARERLRRKFSACGAGVFPPNEADSLFERLQALPESRDVAPLVRALGAVPARDRAHEPER